MLGYPKLLMIPFNPKALSNSLYCPPYELIDSSLPFSPLCTRFGHKHRAQSKGETSNDAENKSQLREADAFHHFINLIIEKKTLDGKGVLRQHHPPSGRIFPRLLSTSIMGMSLVPALVFSFSSRSFRRKALRLRTLSASSPATNTLCSSLCMLSASLSISNSSVDRMPCSFASVC